MLPPGNVQLFPPGNVQLFPLEPFLLPGPKGSSIFSGQVKPLNVYSNCEFMELFIGKKNDGIEGQNLAQLKVVCRRVAGLSLSELNGVEENEYNVNCEKSRKTISSFDLDMVNQMH